MRLSGVCRKHVLGKKCGGQRGTTSSVLSIGISDVEYSQRRAGERLGIAESVSPRDARAIQDVALAARGCVGGSVF